MVERLAALGHGVAFTGRDRARAGDLEARSGAAFIRADARDEDAVARSVTEAAARLGGLDWVVLAAGARSRGRLSATSDESWDEAMSVNLIAPYRYAVRCLDELGASENAAIVMVSSGMAFWPDVDAGAYAVSKRALVWLAQMLSVEAAAGGIRVNAICPGPLATHEQVQSAAAAVEFLLAPAASHVNGTALVVDGGGRASSAAWKVLGP